MAEALPELVWLALLLFLFALVYVSRKFVHAIFSPIIDVASAVPGLGGLLSGALNNVAQSIDNALGSVEHDIDHLMGASWHRFAQLNEWLWRELRGHAVLIAQIAADLFGFGNVVADLRSLFHHSIAGSKGIDAKIKTLERELHGIEGQVKTLERDMTKGIGHDLRTHIKALERDLSHVEHKTIPAIQSDVATADSAISNLYEWAKGKADLLGVGTFAGAVAGVLSLVGLDWLACRSRNSVNGKSGCALWNDIEQLLGAAIVTGLALDLPALIREAQKVTPGIISEVEKLAGL